MAKALTTLGRVVKTIYILRYIHEEDLRRRVQLQLNRGESSHALARWLFFANRGEIRSGDYEEIMNKASCLSLLSNAVLVWNTMAITKIVTQLRAAGDEQIRLMNRPQRDARMLEEAGIALDRGLFPLLVGVGRFGPISVGELADRAGRDYTTVSRQIAKLETLGLVERRGGQADRRVSEAVITSRGQEMTKAIDKARDRILTKMLADWSPQDIRTLAYLLRRLADSALALS